MTSLKLVADNPSPPTGGGGDGPEDPMLENRVAKLEEKVDRLEVILQRLEPKITEILLTGAKQAELSGLQQQIIELQTAGARQSELYKVQSDLSEVKGRLSSLPTWWMLMLAVISTWGAGFAMANRPTTTPAPSEKITKESPQK